MKKDVRIPSHIDFSETGGGYTLSVISGKYKIPIIYLLLSMGVLRHNDLKRRLGSISFKVLSRHLKEMEEDGLITRTEYPEIPPRVEYRLAHKGSSLVPVINAMCDWGQEHHQPCQLPLPHPVEYESEA